MLRLARYTEGMSHLIHRSLLNLMASFVSMASGFLVAVMIARLLGPEGLGATAFAIWFTAAMAAIVDRGWPQTALRFGALSSPVERRATISGIRWQWALGLLGTFVVFAVAAAASLSIVPLKALSEPLILVAICATYSASGFAASSRRACGDFLSPARSSIIGSLLYVPGSIIGASLAGASGAVAALLLRSIPMLPLLRLPLQLGTEKETKRFKPTQEARSYARQTWVSDILDVIVLSRVEYLFLGIFATNAEIGLFSVAIAFAGLVEQLSLQLSAPFVVSFASGASNQLAPERSIDQNNAQQLMYERAAIGLAIVCLPICLGGAAIMSLLLPLVYGSVYNELVSMASVLLVSSVLSAMSVLPWSSLSASGHAKAITRCVLSLAATTIIVMPVAISFWGLWGAVVAKCLVQVVGFSLLQLQLERVGGAKLPTARLSRVFISATSSALSAIVVIYFLKADAVFVLPIAIGAAAVVYLLWLRLTGAVPKSHFSSLVSHSGERAGAVNGLRRSFTKLVSLVLS